MTFLLHIGNGTLQSLRLLGQLASIFVVESMFVRPGDIVLMILLQQLSIFFAAHAKRFQIDFIKGPKHGPKMKHNKFPMAASDLKAFFTVSKIV
uniref:Uncharacterized protein n=1 Tax=Acrobeloides nanus TaxID=290746 RepID=A0A914DK70_9BILA